MEGQTHNNPKRYLLEEQSPDGQTTGQFPSPASVNPIEGALIILVPLGFALSILLGRKYASYRRKRLLQRQIQQLEKLWEINSNNSRR